MGIALQVDTHRDLFIETLRGSVEITELLEVLARTDRLIGNRRSWRCLFDMRDCKLNLDLRQIRLLASATARVHGGVLAVVVDNDLNYALARQFKGFREPYTGRDTVGVFRTLNDADHWLRSTSDPVAPTT